MDELIINRLVGKRILILGFGREGCSTLRFLQDRLPDAVIGIADRNPMDIDTKGVKGVRLHCGEGYLSAMYDYDLVIKTPGISLKDFEQNGVEITSQTDLFLGAFHAQTVGVSGTKGKSTTSSLIYHLLRSAGRDCVLVGNIGIPCFDMIPSINCETVVVYELSAHQLEYVHNSPRAGVLLNIFEEHLDHFGTFERYKQAKLNLLRNMSEEDYAIVHESLMDEVFALAVNSVCYSRMAFEINAERLPIKGGHNFQNACAALCACAVMWLDTEEALLYLYSFKPLEHRLEVVGTFGGVRFVNDSISTIPQTAIAACQTLGEVDFLLLGGFDRNIDYAPLADFLKTISVKCVLVTGKAGQSISKALNDKAYKGRIERYDTMEEAFAVVGRLSNEGDLCLLSPAASSYDQYKNFEERGAKFKTLALQFGRRG